MDFQSVQEILENNHMKADKAPDGNGIYIIQCQEDGDVVTAFMLEERGGELTISPFAAQLLRKAISSHLLSEHSQISLYEETAQQIIIDQKS